MTELEDQFQQVEQKYGLVLPDAYRSMQAAGWMDVKGDGYFWLHEAEWMSLTEILTHERAEYHRPEFVPFAFTGGGDYWCWWPSAHPGTIVFCPHDCYDGWFYAPSFTSFIYRSLLDFCSHGFNAEKEPEDTEENRQILKDSVTRLSNSLPGDWLETLKSLTTAPSVSWTVNGREVSGGLLTDDQKKEIVQHDLAFPLLDQEFQWMYPDLEDDPWAAQLKREIILRSNNTLTYDEIMSELEIEKAKRKAATQL